MALASSGIPALDRLLTDGYPDRSTVLVTGAPGVGKQALGYWFTYSGLLQGDFCLYVTRLSSKEVIRDAKGFGIDYSQKVPLWIAGDDGQIRYDHRDLPGLSFNIKDALKKNSARRIRIVVDVLSPLLMLNSPNSIYSLLTQLLAEVKKYDAILLATFEDGMHDSTVMTAMQALFDGVLELRVYDEGSLRFVSILRILKMTGIPPQPGYFSFSFSREGMEIKPYVKQL
jgi:KaiC/GvpD/RAD55 family RecA-like ATPase